MGSNGIGYDEIGCDQIGFDLHGWFVGATPTIINIKIGDVKTNGVHSKP